MKANELTGAALDWAVAKCEGQDAVLDNGEVCSFKTVNFEEYKFVWQPSTNWAQGGAIIEREKIGVVTSPDDANVWIGSIFEPDWKFNRTGPTPLIAAMRCYVASKLGNEVEIPAELTQGESNGA